jgi:phage terminase large subunit-like protein
MTIAQQKAFVATVELARREKERKRFDWSRNGRPEQQTPPGDWYAWLYMAGRGAGKTRTGSEWLRAEVRTSKYVNLIGATADDIRDILIEGESGILAVCPKDERPKYVPSKRRLEWPSGAKSLLFSADEPDRLRGKQSSGLLCDELSAWRYMDSYTQAMLGLRLGERPRAYISTTPRPLKLLRDLVKDPKVHVTSSNTYANRANLSPAFFSSIITKYEGTRLGRQELDGQLLDDTPGALWNLSRIDELRARTAPDQLTRILVAVDPAVTSGEEADETGIVVVGLGPDGSGWLLADLSGRYTPHEWAGKAVDAWREWNADAVIGEANNGGDMIESTLRAISANIPFRKVWASRGKVARAEPVSALYEQGRCHHVGTFTPLEDEMCSMTTDGSVGDHSPNRADALVWGFSELMLGNGRIQFFPDFRESWRQGEPTNALHVVQ